MAVFVVPPPSVGPFGTVNKLVRIMVCIKGRETFSIMGRKRVPARCAVAIVSSNVKSVSVTFKVKEALSRKVSP